MTSKRTYRPGDRKRTYRPGDRFIAILKADPHNLAREFMLAQVDLNTVTLVSLATGNRWMDPPLTIPGSMDVTKIPKAMVTKHFKTSQIKEWRYYDENA